MMETEHLTRLDSLAREKQRWDLTAKDRVAIAWAVQRIGELAEVAATALAERHELAERCERLEAEGETLRKALALARIGNVLHNLVGLAEVAAGDENDNDDWAKVPRG